MIQFFVAGQVLKVAQPTIVSDTIDYLEVECHFQTAEWENTNKWAHFRKGEQSYSIHLTADRIPKSAHLNLSDGDWEVYIHGTSEQGMRITTQVQHLTVLPSGVLDGQPMGEVPLSTAEQIEQKADNAVKIAQSVRDDADAGKFDGKTPQKGIDYWTPEDEAKLNTAILAKQIADRAFSLAQTNEEDIRLNEIDITNLNSEVDKLRNKKTIFDNSITKKLTWSSKKIVDTFAPIFTQKAPVIRGDFIERYPLSVKSYIDPVQDGDGDPSPNNIRPIKGWFDVKVVCEAGVSSGDTFSGTEFSVQLGQSCYGGVYDWETGTLTVTKSKVIFNGEEAWVTSPVKDGSYRMTILNFAENAKLPESVTERIPGAMCDTYQVTTSVESYRSVEGISQEKDKPYIYIYDNRFNTDNVEPWKAELRQHPVSYVYELASPIIFHFAPNEILALQNSTTLYSNTGDTEVSGRVDPNLTIAVFRDKISALEQELQLVKTEITLLKSANTKHTNDIAALRQEVEQLKQQIAPKP